jgi:hypothetical protein
MDSVIFISLVQNKFFTTETRLPGGRQGGYGENGLGKWNAGILECWKKSEKKSDYYSITPILQYSTGLGFRVLVD